MVRVLVLEQRSDERGVRRDQQALVVDVPVPGTGNDKSLRNFFFTDAGDVWRDGEPIRANDLRASAGFGLSWISPVGPLKMSFGKPLRSKPTDRIQRFQFQIGTAF